MSGPCSSNPTIRCGFPSSTTTRSCGFKPCTGLPCLSVTSNINDYESRSGFDGSGRLRSFRSRGRSRLSAQGRHARQQEPSQRCSKRPHQAQAKILTLNSALSSDRKPGNSQPATMHGHANRTSPAPKHGNKIAQRAGRQAGRSAPSNRCSSEKQSCGCPRFARVLLRANLGSLYPQWRML